MLLLNKHGYVEVSFFFITSKVPITFPPCSETTLGRGDVVACFKEKARGYPENEAADVGPPCNAATFGHAGFGEGGIAAHALLEKPEQQEENGWDGHPKKEEQPVDARPWEKHQVGTHYRRKGAAGSHGRDVAEGIRVDVGRVGRQSAQEVKDEERCATNGGLNVIGKDVEVEHIAQQVQPAAVEEHAGKEGEPVVAALNFGWNGSVFVYKNVDLVYGQRNLIKKEEDIKCQEAVSDECAVTALYLIVSEREEHGL